MQLGSCPVNIDPFSVIPFENIIMIQKNLFVEYSIHRFRNEITIEQAHIRHALTLLDNAAHKEWECHALVKGNRTDNHN